MPKDLAPEADQSQSVNQDAAEISVDSCSPREGRSNEKGKDKEEKEKEKSKDPDKEKGKERDADRKGENEKEKLKGLEGTNLDGLLQRLPGCVSRDLIDQLTVIISLLVLALLYHILFFFSSCISSIRILSLFVVGFPGRFLLFKFKVKSKKAS